MFLPKVYYKCVWRMRSPITSGTFGNGTSFQLLRTWKTDSENVRPTRQQDQTRLSLNYVKKRRSGGQDGCTASWQKLRFTNRNQLPTKEACFMPSGSAKTACKTPMHIGAYLWVPRSAKFSTIYIAIGRCQPTCRLQTHFNVEGSRGAQSSKQPRHVDSTRVYVTNRNTQLESSLWTSAAHTTSYSGNWVSTHTWPGVSLLSFCSAWKSTMWIWWNSMIDWPERLQQLRRLTWTRLPMTWLHASTHTHGSKSKQIHGWYALWEVRVPAMDGQICYSMWWWPTSCRHWGLSWRRWAVTLKFSGTTRRASMLDQDKTPLTLHSQWPGRTTWLSCFGMTMPKIYLRWSKWLPSTSFRDLGTGASHSIMGKERPNYWSICVVQVRQPWGGLFSLRLTLMSPSMCPTRRWSWD